MSTPDYTYFLEELSAANYRWQAEFPSMLTAAKAAGLEGMYWQWLTQTEEGKARQAALDGVPDTLKAETDAREALERFTTQSNYEG